MYWGNKNKILCGAELEKRHNCAHFWGCLILQSSLCGINYMFCLLRGSVEQCDGSLFAG